MAKTALERRLKEAIQWERDPIADVIANSAKDWDNWRISKPRSLAERYASEDIAIRVRFVGSLGEMPKSNLLAVICRTPDAQKDGSLHGEGEYFRSWLGRNLKVDLMLVHPTQEVQPPKGIVSEVLPTLIWLQSLDQGSGVGGNVFETRMAPKLRTTLDGFASIRFFPNDRERGINPVLGAERGPVVGFGISLGVESKGEMVEGVTEVLGGVSDESLPFVNRSGPLQVNDSGAPPGLGIVLYENAIGVSVQPPAYGTIEVIEVVKRSVDLPPVGLHRDTLVSDG